MMTLRLLFHNRLLLPLPVGTLLPESYQSWPHLFTYVPRKAQDLWTQACSQVLSELRDVHLGRGVGSDVDQLILKFLSLPRLLLRRVAGQSHADKKLAGTLFTYLRDKQVPAVPQQHNDSKDTRSDSDRRVSAATRKVKQGHVRKAVDALTQPGMLEITIETLEQLQKLHTLPILCLPMTLSLHRNKPKRGSVATTLPNARNGSMTTVQHLDHLVGLVLCFVLCYKVTSVVKVWRRSSLY